MKSKAMSLPQVQTGRVLELDLAKGMLVIIMLAYHAASVAISNNPQVVVFMNATSFLHFVFVFITGYLCGWHYMPKFSEAPVQTRKRIRVRALKLFVLFGVINALLYIVGLQDIGMLHRSFTGYQDVVSMIFIGVSGSVFGFEILYYIAMFLLFASFFLGARITPVKALIIVGFVALSPFSNVAFYLAFGGVGIFLGYLSVTGKLNAIWKLAKKYWFVIVGLLIVEVVYGGKLIEMVQEHFLYWKITHYAIECALWLLALVFIVVKIGSTPLNNVISKLGNYTLFLYLAQMFILRIGYYLLSSAGVHGYLYYGINLVIGAIGVIVLAYMADFLRARSRMINTLYKVVFA